MYKDIINMPYPNPEIEKDFPDKVNREAQFAPFAALTGYDDAVEETARLTHNRIELDETAKEELSRKLAYIRDNIKTMSQVTITFFVPDDKKDGGEYVSVTDRVKKIRSFENDIVMQNNTVIQIEDIISVEGEELI